MAYNEGDEKRASEEVKRFLQESSSTDLNTNKVVDFSKGDHFSSEAFYDLKRYGFRIVPFKVGTVYDYLASHGEESLIIEQALKDKKCPDYEAKLFSNVTK